MKNAVNTTLNGKASYPNLWDYFSHEIWTAWIYPRKLQVQDEKLIKKMNEVSLNKYILERGSMYQQTFLLSTITRQEKTTKGQ